MAFTSVHQDYILVRISKGLSYEVSLYVAQVLLYPTRPRPVWLLPQLERLLQKDNYLRISLVIW